MVANMLRSTASPALPATELAKRQARWHSFQVVFALAYAGIVLDVATTALGFQAVGSSYEQNPLGGTLIGNLGWVGLFLFMSAIAFVCYRSCRLVCFHMSRRISGFVTALLGVAALIRWVAVITAILFLVQTH
jgi:hypothetical protein